MILGYLAIALAIYCGLVDIAKSIERLNISVHTPSCIDIEKSRNGHDYCVRIHK